MILQPVVRPLLLPVVRALRQPQGGFSPQLLFSAGEQGFLYINDISTMYQDSAGTLPAVLEGPVGKWLDQSGRGNHATQPTSANRPTLKQDAKGNYYVHFNGTNQWMQTGSADFTGTDKMTVFAGVTKLSDAGGMTLVELSASTAANAGAFQLSAAGATGDFGRHTYGSDLNGGSEVFTGASGFASPHSGVLTGKFDLAGATNGAEQQLRVNGADQALTFGVTGPAGGGAFGNYPVYIGARAGTSLFFNGDIYCLSTRGAQTTDSLIAQAERWINARMGGVF